MAGVFGRRMASASQRPLTGSANGQLVDVRLPGGALVSFTSAAAKCGAHVVLREFACVASPRGRRDAAEARVLVPLALNLCAGSVYLPTVSADGSRINATTPRLLP